MSEDTKNEALKLLLNTAAVGAILFLGSKLVKRNKKEEKKTSENLIGIELGGTGSKISVINRTWNATAQKYDYQVKNRFSVESTVPEETITKLFDLIKGTSYTQVGIASFGPVCLNKQDPRYGYITSTPKLEWQNFPLVQTVKQKSGCNSVFLDTDVNGAALSEYELGNHNAKSLIYITVGTGVGVGVVVDGKPVHGLTHPEGGHILVRPSELDRDYEGVCPYHKNCLEGLVSNKSIVKRLGLGSVHDLPAIELEHQVWDIIGYYLAQLCLNLTLIASPEVIIIGGGIMSQPNLLSSVQRQFTQLLNNYVEHPRLQDVKNYIKLPTLGVDAGVLGGAVLCLH